MEIVPSARTWKWFGRDSRPWMAIAFVALFEVTLFVGYHVDRWRHGLAKRSDPRVQRGEGLVIRSDGLGYYAWLRSSLFDGDWSFDNEFDEHNPLGDEVPTPTSRTAVGLRSNNWSVGPACVWALAVIPTRLCLLSLESLGVCETSTGYEFPYQLAVGCTSVLFALLGLGLLYGICRHFAAPAPAALAAGVLTLGSTVVFYSAVEVAMAHGLGTAAVAGLVWYWLRSYGSVRPGRWLLVGILVGLAALMRWQLVTFALLPTGECLLTCLGNWRSGSRKDIGRVIGFLALAGLGAVVVFLPQLFAWRAVYGCWLPTPVAHSHNWLAPAWGRVLASTDRGLFYWTPLALLALGGAAVYAGRGPAKPATQAHGILLAAFVLQVYVMASLWGRSVELGDAYGFRHLTESMVALGPGLALLLERALRRWFAALAGLACLLALWNLQLIAQYRYFLVPRAGGAEPGELLANAWRLIIRRKVSLLGPVVAGPVLLWLLLGRGAARRAPLASLEVDPTANLPGGDGERQASAA